MKGVGTCVAFCWNMVHSQRRTEYKAITSSKHDLISLSAISKTCLAFWNANVRVDVEKILRGCSNRGDMEIQPKINKQRQNKQRLCNHYLTMTNHFVLAKKAFQSWKWSIWTAWVCENKFYVSCMVLNKYTPCFSQIFFCPAESDFQPCSWDCLFQLCPGCWCFMDVNQLWHALAGRHKHLVTFGSKRVESHFPNQWVLSPKLNSTYKTEKGASQSCFGLSNPQNKQIDLE